MAQAICVYCSSSLTVPRVYIDAARTLGTLMGERGHTLVFGGGKIGLMGELARAVQAAGGRVVGVIPAALRDRELALESADELIVTNGMHERKATMARRADAFVALPGGFGTFEELCEILAHRQLDLHTKPCVVINVGGYYDHLLAQFERAFAEGFTSDIYRGNYGVVGTPLEALEWIEAKGE